VWEEVLDVSQSTIALLYLLWLSSQRAFCGQQQHYNRMPPCLWKIFFNYKSWCPSLFVVNMVARDKLLAHNHQCCCVVIVSKLWEMFHYHLPFIKIVSVISLSYNIQPLCFICIMNFVILVSYATKNLLHAHFHTSNKERLVFVSHKHYVFPLWNIGSKLIL
jgi:hypothetical protein